MRVGSPGDGRYLQGWHGKDAGSEPSRWSTPVSRLLLPVTPGEPYTITLEVNAPQQALTPEAGLYLESKKIASLQASHEVTARLPSCPGDKVRLELRAGGWVPQQVIAGSADTRILGVQVFRVTMRSASGGKSIFNANTGRWLAPARPKP